MDLDALRMEAKTITPTNRLDTILRGGVLPAVDYPRIDAQGADFAVIRSAGSRLKDVRIITLEVDVTPVRFYEGSAGCNEIIT